MPPLVVDKLFFYWNHFCKKEWATLAVRRRIGRFQTSQKL